MSNFPNKKEQIALNEIVICDVELSNQFAHYKQLERYLKAKTNPRPNPKVKCRVIEKHSHCVYVEIIDDFVGKKRDFANTDKYGSTALVYNECIEQPKQLIKL